MVFDDDDGIGGGGDPGEVEEGIGHQDDGLLRTNERDFVFTRRI